MDTDETAIKIRIKFIATMLKEERLKSRKTIEECAEFIGVETNSYEQIESGALLPSLPELELLSYYLDVPLDFFFNGDYAENLRAVKIQTQPERWIRLRQRMIGARLHQIRLENNISLKELAQKLNIEPEKIEAYEMGLEAVPLPTLEALAGSLNRSIKELQDQDSFVGVWNLNQRAMREYLALPAELQAFVGKQVNRPYLELAVRLSEMSVDRLRAIAEGLLEITY